MPKCQPIVVDYEARTCTMCASYDVFFMRRSLAAAMKDCRYLLAAARVQLIVHLGPQCTKFVFAESHRKEARFP